ncbi:alpha-1,2-fucosyltransferase [Pseudanabaena biceps]|nr:alpha-1,2-fucosyltransferase [Pseudanabaena biceps]
MIIVKLQGGLGNQMFQYAIGKKLSLLNKTELKLDLSFLLDRTPRPNFTYRDYNLNIFNLKIEFATQEEIKPFINYLDSKIKRKIYTYLFLGKKNKYINEKKCNFNPDIFKLTGNIYLDGYWQTEKYFNDIKNILYNDFIVKTNQDQKNQDVAKTIKNTNSVSIHIRRGDYIDNKQIYHFHGICDLNYYYNCVNLLLKKLKNPNFFIFSDDHQWMKENLKLDYPMTFVDHNDASKNYEDLRLMSQCKHNIIANSSFSWWGAWLNQNPDKIVYAPQKWFNDTSKKTQDLIPDQWIRV